MGTKHALPPSTADMPTHVEGLVCGTNPDRTLTVVEKVYVGVRYWDGATDVGEFLLGVTHGALKARGGSDEQWTALVAMASNNEPDDLIETMCDESWGHALLWARWYRHLGE